MQKKEIMQFSITGVLVVIFFLIISHNLGKKKQSKKALDKNALSTAGATVKEKETGIGLYLKLEEETKSLDLMRDPFSMQPIKVTSDGLYLSGIAWEEKNSTAIINGKIVKAGDEIDGKTVVDIKKDRVILNDGIRNIQLNLGR